MPTGLAPVKYSVPMRILIAIPFSAFFLKIFKTAYGSHSLTVFACEKIINISSVAEDITFDMKTKSLFRVLNSFYKLPL
jgi:hypothetical protein